MDSTIQKKTYTIIITRDEGDVGGFVGMCDELYANSQVETYDEIMENMKEAVETCSRGIWQHERFQMLAVQE